MYHLFCSVLRFKFKTNHSQNQSAMDLITEQQFDTCSWGKVRLTRGNSTWSMRSNLVWRNNNDMCLFCGNGALIVIVEHSHGSYQLQFALRAFTLGELWTLPTSRQLSQPLQTSDSQPLSSRRCSYGCDKLCTTTLADFTFAILKTIAEIYI